MDTQAIPTELAPVEPPPKVDPSTFPRKITKPIEVELTPDEVAEMVAAADEAFATHDAMDAAEKARKKDAKAALDLQLMEARRLLASAHAGVEERNVECEVQLNPDGTVHTVRLDTGEVIEGSVRRARDNELQQTMFRMPPEDDEPEVETAAPDDLECPGCGEPLDEGQPLAWIDKTAMHPSCAPAL